MHILGINTGHNATAAMLRDGEILACASEERFSRLKNHIGFPYEAVKYVIEYSKINPREIDGIILTKNRGNPLGKKGKKFDSFFANYKKKTKIQRGLSYMTYKYPLLTGYFIDMKKLLVADKKYKQEEEKNIKFIANSLGIEKEKIIYADHHMLHAFSTYGNLPKNKKTLIFTLDGEGLSENNENICASVNIFDGKNIKRISKTLKRASLGYLYGLFTIYLGMKPHEHEFKVMGLAPYAKKDKAEKLYSSFKDILWVDGFEFKSKFRMQYADAYLNEKMRYERFDNIAYCIQKLTEDLTCKWIKNTINKTGISNIALAGGVFMNVKASQKIAEMPEVKNIWVMPSCGDESTAIGACFYGYHKICSSKNIAFEPKPIKDLYLGPEYNDEFIEKFLENGGYTKKYNVKKCKNVERKVAKLLAKEEVVGRLVGRSEWGARALGNRSILSNPSSTKNVRILNEMIKNRDFWMPFTPSILHENIKEYIINPKKIFCPYMVITFNSTEKAKRELPAAMHPYDETIRPQEVMKDWNESYHKILKEFKKLTKISGVLNTSFNLHGEPNVLTPKDAMHTFENSGMKYLALENYIISKK